LSLQPTLFELLQEAKTISSPINFKGGLDIDTELRASLSADLRHAADERGRDLSRAEVAARMSDLTGQEITLSMLNNWTAEAHEKHRFPAAYLPAFVHATGGQARAFEVLSRYSGRFALPGPEALRAEIQRLDEEENRIRAEKKKRRLFLKEMGEGI